MPSTTSCLSSPNATPFLITVQDAILLEDSEGFGILRQHLASDCCNDFCKDHETNLVEDRQSWILMRDILHALLAPVVALHDHATKIGQKFTKATKPEDIEYAFRAKGRNAFVWLNSFLADDQDWCLSKDCPACVVQHALDAEFQIRLMISACMLSRAKGPEPGDGPTLPSFDFFLRSLRDALDEDELWGPDYYDYVEPKAEDLNLGMQDLMRQCEKLELAMTPPGTPNDVSLPSFSYFSERRMSLMTPPKTVYPRRQTAVPGITIKRSKLAKVQMKMAQEEQQWIQTFVANAWQSLNSLQMEMPSMNTLARRVSLVAGP
jgi:hypothetical protein